MKNETAFTLAISFFFSSRRRRHRRRRRCFLVIRKLRSMRTICSRYWMRRPCFLWGGCMKRTFSVKFPVFISYFSGSWRWAVSSVTVYILALYFYLILFSLERNRNRRQLLTERLGGKHVTGILESSLFWLGLCLAMRTSAGLGSALQSRRSSTGSV